MEFLVRLADDKYIKNGNCKSIVQATRMLFASCETQIKQYDQYEWRWARYYNEMCDIISYLYRPLIEHIYSLYASQAKPGYPLALSLSKFKLIWIKLGLMNADYFQERDILMAYNLGMMLQVDELFSDRIF